MKFEPCVLCWYQRIFMYPFVLWLGIAVAKKDYRIASYSLPIATIGACISLYHYAIQKSQHFQLLGQLWTCTMYGRIHKLVRFCDNPVLALIGFITIAVCSFIVIKTNKEMKE